MAVWDSRYATDTFVYGKEPSGFVLEHVDRFAPGESALAVADGEGRNGVYLARLGLTVHAIDASQVGLDKAAALATEHGVSLRLEQADLAMWEWPTASYDHVLGVFIQFADPEFRARMFAGMRQALKPGGLLLLHGYRPEQITLGTGGPPDPAYMYTPELLRQHFGDYDILHLAEEDRVVEEGTGHIGPSALISLVARKPKR